MQDLGSKENSINHRAIDRQSEIEFERGYERRKPVIAQLYQISRNDPAVRMFLHGWERGMFASFEDMLCNLVVTLQGEKKRHLETAMVAFQTQSPPPMVIKRDEAPSAEQPTMTPREILLAKRRLALRIAEHIQRGIESQDGFDLDMVALDICSMIPDSQVELDAFVTEFSDDEPDQQSAPVDHSQSLPNRLRAAMRMPTARLADLMEAAIAMAESLHSDSTSPFSTPNSNPRSGMGIPKH